MAKFTKISFALIFALILIMMFIAESRPTPTGNSGIEFQNKLEIMHALKKYI
jgi:hypothetical protein